MAHHTSMGGKLCSNAKTLRIDDAPATPSQGRVTAEMTLRAEAALTLQRLQRRFRLILPIGVRTSLPNDCTAPSLTTRQRAQTEFTIRELSLSHWMAPFRRTGIC